MRIKLWIANDETNEHLQELGTCLTDSPNRAVQMYKRDHADEITALCNNGYAASIRWKDVTDPAAASLGHRGGIVKSERKTAANQAKSSLPPKPGRKQRGRPHKQA